MNKLNVHWDDIVGLEECKTAIKEAVVYPLKYPIFFNGPFSPWKGILLYGPPGTGNILVFFLRIFKNAHEEFTKQAKRCWQRQSRQNAIALFST